MKSFGVQGRIVRWLFSFVFLIALQTLTYFTLGPRQLKDKLLTYPLDEIGRHSDSVFVRDFYYNIGDSFDNNIRDSHHLNDDEDLIKSRLKVKHVYFDTQEKFDRNDTTELRYNFHYETYTERQDWVTLFGFYSAKQIEFLSVGDQYSYVKDMSYRWFFFFWIPTFERQLENCHK